MTGLDTNVLVRYLAQDDEEQLRRVLAMLLKKKATLFVPDLVLVETDWALTSLYGWTAHEVVDAFERLLLVHNLAFEDEGRLRAALRAVRQGADLSDELIVAQCLDHGCKALATFDKPKAKRHSKFAAPPK